MHGVFFSQRHSCNSTNLLPSLLSLLRLPSQESSSIITSAGLESSLHSLGTYPTENTVTIVIAQQYLDCCSFIRYRGNLFTGSLPSNERLLWLRYSGFQASCHNTLIPTFRAKNCNCSISRLWCHGGSVPHILGSEAEYWQALTILLRQGPETFWM
jgi:hypothetical protein